MSLIKELFDKGFIKKEQVASSELEVKKTGKRIEQVLLEKHIVEESVLFFLKSESLNISLKKVVIDNVSLDALALIPKETAKHYLMIAFAKKDNSVEIGMVYPEDLKAQEALKFLARQGKFTYKVFLITPTTFTKILKQYRGLKKEVGKALEELKTELATEAEKKRIKTPAEFARLAEEAPITKIVAVILRHAVEGKASDIHIERTKEELRIRFRLLGELYSSILLPLKIHPAVVARIKILSNIKIDESRIPQDGRFSTVINDEQIDFRVSTFPTTLGEKVAIRVLDPSAGLKSFEELGLTKRNIKVLEEEIKRPYGLVLVTGPSGSGKSTTLYAILNLLNKEGVNIVSLEDPVEYFIEGVNQSQVKPQIGYDFAQGLRHILRQDPDIIMVGEVRDSETASLVIHAALTGHIVLSTLHTNNAVGVVPRLIDMGVQSYLISPCLSFAIAQRLVRRLCDLCKKEIKPLKQVEKIILKEIDTLPPQVKKDLEMETPFKIWEAKGCKKCNNSGFSGRIGLFEILSMTNELVDIISKQPSEEEILKEAKRQGMITLRQDGVLKVLNGITTIEEIIRVTKQA